MNDIQITKYFSFCVVSTSDVTHRPAQTYYTLCVPSGIFTCLTSDRIVNLLHSLSIYSLIPSSPQHVLWLLSLGRSSLWWERQRKHNLTQVMVVLTASLLKVPKSSSGFMPPPLPAHSIRNKQASLSWLSKPVHFVALLKLPTAHETADHLGQHFLRFHGNPWILSHTGVLNSSLRYGRHSVLSGFYPQTNVQMERVNQDLEAVLRCVTTSNPLTWSSQLTWTEWGHDSLCSHRSVSFCRFLGLPTTSVSLPGVWTVCPNTP